MTIQSIIILLNAYFHRIQEFTIHGLGAAIQMAVKLALNLKDQRPVDWIITTDSVELIDDIISNGTTQKRINSAIHICIKKS